MSAGALQGCTDPAVFPQRFRMLLASPAACYRLFREKQKEGQGEATMFKGKGTALSGTAGATRGHFPAGCPSAGCLPATPSLLRPYFGKASGMGGIRASV